MTAAPSVYDIITILPFIIVILRKEKIYFLSFDLSSPTSDHHNESELLCIALRLDKLKREQLSLLRISSHHYCESLLYAAMLFNKKSTQQRFSGVKTSTRVMKTLSNDMVFWYVHLHWKDVDSSTWVIHIYVICDVVNDSGVPKPITAGFFEHTVK